MRLTLRTMLAYLDGILEPNDAQDLGKKVEESEFATNLMHRIRDVMRRLRLGAPSLTDRGPRLDPNTVAEYLDNTLAVEQVTDFEKVCLDSDVHLAEVASCHQILTLVLGEPAEIDSAGRQRMYRLAGASAETKTAGTATEETPRPAHGPGTPPPLSVTALDDESEAERPRPKLAVPEYLRERQKKGRFLPAAALVVVVVCVIIVVMMMLGLTQPGTPVGNFLVRMGIVAPSQELATGPDTARKEKGEAKKRGEAPPAQDVGKEPVKEPIAKGPKEASEGPASETVQPPAREPTANPAAQPPAEPAKTPEVPPPGPAVPEPPNKSAPKASAESPAGVAVGPEKGSTKEEVSKPAAKPAVLPPEPMGRFMSGDQVLLKYDESAGWTRVAMNQMVLPGRLLVLPTYRVKLTLSIGVNLDIVGGSQVELLASSLQEPPGIRVLFGRVVMMPLAKAGPRLRVKFGDRGGDVVFSDAESVAALEVRRVHLPGTNPETAPEDVEANLYAVTGGISWAETGGGQPTEPLRLSPLQRVSFDGQATSPPASAKELPKWIAGEPLRYLDRNGSTAIAQSLGTDRPARVGLLELTSRPQKEVRWLALRCLGYVGQFHDMVVVLNEPAQKLVWSDYVDQLREAVARDPQSAAAVRQALEQQYPQQAAELYRMLWGYSDKDLQSGADKELVNALEDELLAVRVLAISDLMEITAGPDHGYKPWEMTLKRKLATQRWHQLLEAKKIRVKAPEDKAGAAAREAPATTAPDSEP